MAPSALRTILLGYTVSGVAAALLYTFGSGVIVAGLVWWLGGAVSTLAVAAVALRRGAQDDPAALADLARWDADAHAASRTRPAARRRRAS